MDQYRNRSRLALLVHRRQLHWFVGLRTDCKSCGSDESQTVCTPLTTSSERALTEALTVEQPRRLTDAKLRALVKASRQRPELIFDGSVPGLSIRFGKKPGSGTWSLLYRVMGEGADEWNDRVINLL
jgi:hypothetical protein